MSNASRSQVGRLSARVALSATGFVAVLYLLISVIIVAWLTLSLTAQVDGRLARALTFQTFSMSATDRPARDVSRPEPPADIGDPAGQPGMPPTPPLGRERVTWTVAADGTVTTDREDLPLPAEYVGLIGPETIVIVGSEIRAAGTSTEDGHVIVGESMGAVNDARSTVILGLLIVAPFLLLGVFFGSFAVGRRVATPIEHARQRQLAFTADASHELRTPLSVIEANASLALAEEREGAWYRRAFERVLDELRRMHRLLEEMLWLARFDATDKPPKEGPVDLGVVVEQAADRFSSVAAAKSISLEVAIESPGRTLTAPAAWMDQLVGVLLDNACKYSPTDGRIVVRVDDRDGRTSLTVDDNGPGIPEAERERIFDRFHRDSSQPGGSGLGLAIADAIVRATDGRWQVGSSPAGGARMSVSWAGHGSAEERP